ncbi:BspA family leucine-rich repeat surface protein [Levilactobacillus parabrevis]|nr:BspA family leucine-rich repeat surface protein [Levilactobacillus parabrevis]MCT4491073.1 BspA family leucine-rich repeat surface protein [Levilactobacillus parabrevis]
MPALPTIGTEVVAHASDAKVVDSGTLGTCPWTLTADGVMHVGSGELPEAKAQYGGYVTPFFDINIKEAGLGRKINTISFEGQVKTPVNASFLFSGFSDDAPQIKNWTELDTSNSTNFAYMFYGSNQDTVDVSSFDTSKATDMHGMFMSTNLVTGYENLDTSHVTDMSSMFDNYGDEDNPSTLDLSKFKVDMVNGDESTNNFGTQVPGGFYRMFNSVNVRGLNIGNWSPKIPLTGMFNGSDSSKISKLTLSSQANLTGSALPELDPVNNDDLAGYTGKWENSNDQYLRPDDSNKTTYTTAGLISEYNGSTAPAGNQTYQWEPTKTPGNPVTIHYIDQDGKTIQADAQLPGAWGATYTIKPATINGYQYVSATEGSLTGTYTSDPQSVTLSYKVAPVTPPVTPGGTDSSSSSESSSSSDSSSTGDQGHAVVVAQKDRAITAIKKLGLYSTPDFSKKTRQYYYAKQKRTLRPQFVITGVAQSKNGVKRYLVRDVTAGSKRYGKTGYITAKRAFTVHTYYQHNPKRVKVILGTNAYRDKALKHQIKHLKRGKVLHVKKIVRHHLTTRLVLSDGSFVTSNKTKVIEK